MENNECVKTDTKKRYLNVFSNSFVSDGVFACKMEKLQVTQTLGCARSFVIHSTQSRTKHI